MTLKGFEKVKKVAEHQWRLKTTLIFRPTSADSGCTIIIDYSLGLVLSATLDFYLFNPFFQSCNAVLMRRLRNFEKTELFLPVLNGDIYFLFFLDFRKEFCRVNTSVKMVWITGVRFYTSF
jgi:hypothetical protein